MVPVPQPVAVVAVVPVPQVVPHPLDQLIAEVVEGAISVAQLVDRKVIPWLTKAKHDYALRVQEGGQGSLMALRAVRYVFTQADRVVHWQQGGVHLEDWSAYVDSFSRELTVEGATVKAQMMLTMIKKRLCVRGCVRVCACV